MDFCEVCVAGCCAVAVVKLVRLWWLVWSGGGCDTVIGGAAIVTVAIDVTNLLVVANIVVVASCEHLGIGCLERGSRMVAVMGSR